MEVPPLVKQLQSVFQMLEELNVRLGQRHLLGGLIGGALVVGMVFDHCLNSLRVTVFLAVNKLLQGTFHAYSIQLLLLKFSVLSVKVIFLLLPRFFFQFLLGDLRLL